MPNPYPKFLVQYQFFSTEAVTSSSFLMWQNKHGCFPKINKVKAAASMKLIFKTFIFYINIFWFSYRLHQLSHKLLSETRNHLWRRHGSFFPWINKSKICNPLCHFRIEFKLRRLTIAWSNKKITSIPLIVIGQFGFWIFQDQFSGLFSSLLPQTN